MSFLQIQVDDHHVEISGNSMMMHAPAMYHNTTIILIPYFYDNIVRKGIVIETLRRGNLELILGTNLR